MRPGEDANSVVIGNPLTLETLGIPELLPLEAGIPATVDYFTRYLASR